MALNFAISAHREDDRLHVHVSGDFDEVSAEDLIRVLEGQMIGLRVGYVGTKDLVRIDKEARSAFHQYLNTHGNLRNRLVFINDCAPRIAPIGGIDWF